MYGIETSSTGTTSEELNPDLRLPHKPSKYDFSYIFGTPDLGKALEALRVQLKTSPRLTLEPNLIQPARASLSSVSDSRLFDQTLEILNELQNEIYQLEDKRDIPPIRLFEGEDGSLSIEWIFEHFRVAFSIENDPEQSSWHLVSDSSFGGINAFGFLSKIELNPLIAWLVCFVTHFA